MRILSGLWRGRGWLLGLMAAGLLLIACGSPPASEQATRAPTGESVPPSPTVTTAPPAATAVPTSVPSATTATSSALPDIPVGFTAEGFPYRGNPDAAVTMVEFSDYQCPFCLRHVQQTSPLLDKNYIATGKVKHVFRDFPIDSIHPQARKAAEAARCAGAQGAELYWAMHDRLFSGQNAWANQPDAIATFKSYAVALKLDKDKFDACLDSGQTGAAVQTDVAAGEAAGVDGTPAFRINEWVVSGAQPYDVFQQVLDAASRGEKPPPTPTPLPENANALSADPNRPGYTYSG
ncbi:MAG: thioredoxin domain-containing protein, partial [Anaerolineae bacterium]|nr:thioredoxin domain-containing protein [Anaerolineae bacterium]